MITYLDTDIFTTPAQAIVNPVNTVGVMGSGLAKAIRDRYPEMYESYRQLCLEGNFKIGDLAFYLAVDRWIINFPTKRHYRQRSRLSDIERGLQALVGLGHDLPVTSVAFPKLGCGHGGRDWDGEVMPLMERYLAGSWLDCYVHLHDGSRR